MSKVVFIKGSKGDVWDKLGKIILSENLTSDELQMLAEMNHPSVVVINK